MAADSTMVWPSAVTRTGALPRGWTSASDGGALRVLGFLLCRTRLYSIPSSSSNHRMRCDCETLGTMSVYGTEDEGTWSGHHTFR